LSELHENIPNKRAHILVPYKIQKFIILEQYYFLHLIPSTMVAFHWIHPMILHLSWNICLMH